jgi:predicted transcriptional regulator
MADAFLPEDLSRRERQVYGILVRLGRAAARDVERELPNPPTYSAVRSILRILVGKGLVRKERASGRDWFVVAAPMARTRTGAVETFVRNFFEGSAASAACALLGRRNVRLSAEEAGRLRKLIEEARRP